MNSFQIKIENYFFIFFGLQKTNQRLKALNH